MSAMGVAVAAVGLTKSYRRTPALIGLDLEVRTGEVFGYLGPNGAGKTTTLRLLLDLIRPTAGEVRVLGEDPRGNPGLRRRIGYLPGELVLYERLTVQEMLDHLAALHGGVDAAYRRALCERLDLDPSRRIRGLSRGNKQKVGLVQALMARPELLVLDEPTGGLDPIGQRAVRDLLDEAREEGRTVFLSSHLLHEVEEVADRVGILRAGRLVAVESVGGLKARSLHSVTVRFGGEVPGEVLAAVPGVADLEVEGPAAHFSLRGPIDPVLKELARHQVLDLSVAEADLEEIVLTFYGAGAADA